MSDGYFASALNSLQKPQEKARLLKILVAIRKEIDWPKNKDNLCALREKGCLKNVILCLNNESGSILDVTLSILGNCCMDKNCSRELVNHYNILPNLCHILKRGAQLDSINGRIFRIIGNLCQHFCGLWDTILEREPQIVDHIVQFLNNLCKEEDVDNNYSNATVNMAIRALRSLCHNTTVIPLIMTHGVLRAVALTLIKYTQEWTDNKSHEDVLINIIRLLREYSRYNFKESIAQLRNTDKGNSLLCLGNLLTLAPQRVIDVVVNFVKIATLKSDLPIPGICQSLINGLQPSGTIIYDNVLCKQYLKCLSLVLEHPGNRDNIRNSDSVTGLVNILRHFDSVTEKNLECLILIISTIRKCLLDDAFAGELLQKGIINVLIDKLEMVVGVDYTTNVEHEMVKKSRKLRMSHISKRISNRRLKTCYYPVSPVTSDEDFDYPPSPSRSYSPSSTSELSSFDGYSSPSSPFTNYDGDSCDSDDYSPVCSEVEDDIIKLPNSVNDDVISSYESELPPEVYVDSEQECSNTADAICLIPKTNISEKVKSNLVTEIVKIVKSFVISRCVMFDLVSPRLFTALIKSEKFLNSNCPVDLSNLLRMIFETHEYLLPIMQTDFIPMIYSEPKTQHGNICRVCSNVLKMRKVILESLSFTAESECGKGDIAHKLLRGDSKIVQDLVIVIPYIIRNKTILKQLMIHCGGLQTLMNLIKEESSGLQNQVLRTTYVLASKALGIKSPVDKSIDNSVSAINSDYEANLVECIEIVTFRLDDNSVVKADRKFLSNTSDYFSRLLNGDFKESHEEEVALKDVTCESLKCLFNLLRLKVKRTDLIKFDVELTTLLDVIVLTDRYLMEDLNLCLVRCVEQFCFSAKTMPVIYRWAIESRTNILRIESVAYALVCEVRDDERILMFQSICEFGYVKQLAEDVHSLLVRYLHIKCR